MKTDILFRILRGAALQLGLIFSLTVGLSAGADELDDQVKQACAGLSVRFNSSGPKNDVLDDDIAKDMDGNADLKAVVARARITGSARACGADTKSAESRLDASAAALFAGSAAKAKRIVQILHCTEARTARDAGSHWGSQQFCAQAQRSFDTYVTHNQPPP